MIILVHYTSCSELEDLLPLEGNSPLDPPIYFPSYPWVGGTSKRSKIDSAVEILKAWLVQEAR